MVLRRARETSAIHDRGKGQLLPHQQRALKGEEIQQIHREISTLQRDRSRTKERGTPKAGETQDAAPTPPQVIAKAMENFEIYDAKPMEWEVGGQTAREVRNHRNLEASSSGT